MNVVRFFSVITINLYLSKLSLTISPGVLCRTDSNDTGPSITGRGYVSKSLPVRDYVVVGRAISLYKCENDRITLYKSNLNK